MYLNSCLPWGPDTGQVQKTLQLAYRLGYQGAFLNFKTKIEYDALLKSGLFPAKRPAVDLPLDHTCFAAYHAFDIPLAVFPRVTLSPPSPQALKQQLATWIGKRVVIAVESQDKGVLEVAARDGRVDIIALPSIHAYGELTKGILSLIRQNQVFLDVHMAELVASYGSKRTRYLRQLYKLLKQAKPQSYRYLAGTGHYKAGRAPPMVRGPRETAALFSAVLGVPEPLAKGIAGANAEALAFLFIKRDQDLFIDAGVEIVDRQREGNTR